MVMKNYYIYRTQFPLILPYAVAIVPDVVLGMCNCRSVQQDFADGMAYVALSRVKSLAGLHLSSFDSISIQVNLGCIKEINRLRKFHQSDLPLLDVPSIAVCKSVKRKVAAIYQCS